MLWGYFAASGTGGLEHVQEMKPTDDQGVLDCNVQPIVQKLGLL